MNPKHAPVLVFLLVISMSFVSSATYPDPFNPCNCSCPEGYKLTHKVSDNSIDDCDKRCECIKIEKTPTTTSITPIPSTLNTPIIDAPRTMLDEDTVQYSGSSLLFIEESSSNKKSQEEQDCKYNGCFKDDYCYPKEYQLEKEYCGKDPYLWDKYKIEQYKFLNQSKTGENCNNDYECETNICLEGVCINRTEEINLQVDAKVGEIKQNITNKIEDSLNKFNGTENISINIEYGEVSINNIVFEKILNWIKNILNTNKSN